MSKRAESAFVVFLGVVAITGAAISGAVRGLREAHRRMR
jgi:hypothetical protein